MRAHALKSERADADGEFEKRLRNHVNDRIAGKDEAKADFSKVDADKLTLVDTSAMDESVRDRQHHARRRERSATTSC